MFRASSFLAVTVQASAASLQPYPGYAGDLQVTGSAGAFYYYLDQVGVWFDLEGLEADNCATVPAGVANACGIHIHEGTTCDDAEAVGGHYWGTLAKGNESITSDPWAAVSYNVTEDGKAKGTIQDITIGVDQDISGRALVVHDSAGARVACALLPGGDDKPSLLENAQINHKDLLHFAVGVAEGMLSDAPHLKNCVSSVMSTGKEGMQIVKDIKQVLADKKFVEILDIVDAVDKLLHLISQAMVPCGATKNDIGNLLAALKQIQGLKDLLVKVAKHIMIDSKEIMSELRDAKLSWDAKNFEDVGIHLGSALHILTLGAQPVPAPAPPSPMPSGSSNCCYGEANATCSTATTCPANEFCGESEANCLNCNGVWCVQPDDLVV